MADTPEHSKSLTVAEAADVIAGLPTYEAVLAFVGDDERSGVLKAVDDRSAELAAPSPELDAGATRLAASPGPEAKPGSPLEEGGSGKAIVRTRYPVDRFEHSVAGVPTITSKGVEVDRGKVADLLEAARSAGTELEEAEA